MARFLTCRGNAATEVIEALGLGLGQRRSARRSRQRQRVAVALETVLEWSYSEQKMGFVILREPQNDNWLNRLLAKVIYGG